jgi:hypothetical protein
MLYDNCKLLSPQGELLALIDAKRAKWYIKKELGTLEAENPLTVKLKFEPSNSTNREDLFYLTPRENKCVVCGTTTDLTRHHVVPQSFRKHFDLEIKSRSSHDVLAVCRKCHDDYNVYETEFRRILTERYGIPPLTFDQNPGLERKYVSAAKALLSGHKLPVKREDELLELLIDFLGKWPEKEDLQHIATSINPYVRVGCKTMSEYIVNQLSFEELSNLAKEWRVHFIETMKPKYLPFEWSIDRELAESSASKKPLIEADFG